MKRSCFLGLAGSLMTSLLMSAGCGGSETPQQSTPTFESRVGEATPRVEPAPAPAPTPSPAQTDPLVGGPGSSPSTAAGTGMATPPTAPSGPSEREMCDALLVDAKLQVEDIQGGAALVITPKAGGDLEALKQAARTIESKMPPAGMSTPPPGTGSSGPIPPSGTSPGGSTGTTTGATATGSGTTTGAGASASGSPAGSPSASDVPAPDACGLFDLGRQGARASVVEQQKGVRILLTASDPASVKPLRAKARELVKSMATQSTKTPSGKTSGQTGSPATGAPPTKGNQGPATQP
jgi:hypothetical protein